MSTIIKKMSSYIFDFEVVESNVPTFKIVGVNGI